MPSSSPAGASGAPRPRWTRTSPTRVVIRNGEWRVPIHLNSYIRDEEIEALAQKHASDADFLRAVTELNGKKKPANEPAPPGPSGAPTWT